MPQEPRPNWLAQVVAGAVVLPVAELVELLLGLTGLTVGEGAWRVVADGVRFLALVVGFTLLSTRLARTRWGAAGEHEAELRRSPRLLALAVAVGAGLATYVVTLLVLLGLGVMDGDDTALYPTAGVAAFLGFVLTTLAWGPLTRRRG